MKQPGIPDAKPSRVSPKKSAAAKQRDRQREKLKNIFADGKIFAFVTLGVIAPDAINVAQREIDLSGLSIEYLLYAFGAAMIAVGAQESEGSLEGKKQNWKRRAFSAFMTGAGALALMEKLFG
ncbi:MAG: hypothetical protein GY783_09860 [Gammaproteobacteria bacterium]|nr:hypothetical protein [Gammaproteobacteria bacterium]